MGRPATGVTPGQHFRIPTEVSSKLAEIAEAEGRTRTDVLVEALNRHFIWWDRRRRSNPADAGQGLGPSSRR